MEQPETDPHATQPFGALIHFHRQRLGWSLRDLQRRLGERADGPSASLVWYWQSGERMPRLRHVALLAEALGLTVSDRLAAFDAHAAQWEGGPARQVLALARRFGWTDLQRLDAYDVAARQEAS